MSESLRLGAKDAINPSKQEKEGLRPHSGCLPALTFAEDKVTRVFCYVSLMHATAGDVVCSCRNIEERRVCGCTMPSH
jgi:hypothetical protein